MDSVDVLVVGAGPAGSTAAARLAKAGHTVRVVEEHPKVGHPVQCAGLVSQRVLDLAGSDAMVRTTVRGASVFGPSLESISFRADSPRAFVIDRAGLDIYLADRAARAGAEIRTSTRFDGVEGESADRLTVRLKAPDGSTETVRPRLVIGADGVSSKVARAFRLRRPVEVLPAFEAEFPESPGDPDTVEVYLGRKFAPGLFGWWIPDGAGGARVGVATDADGTPTRRYFDHLLDYLERRFGRRLANPTAYLVSGIPIGTLPRTHGRRVLLVGDAAAQVKPLSGGGSSPACAAPRSRRTWLPRVSPRGTFPRVSSPSTTVDGGRSSARSSDERSTCGGCSPAYRMTSSTEWCARSKGPTSKPRSSPSGTSTSRPTWRASS